MEPAELIHHNGETSISEIVITQHVNFGHLFDSSPRPVHTDSINREGLASSPLDSSMILRLDLRGFDCAGVLSDVPFQAILKIEAI